MSISGPINLSGGWVSDADIWNPTNKGGAYIYQNFIPDQGGARTVDVLLTYGTVTGAPNILGFFYWQDAAQVGTANRDILIALTGNAKCYTSPFSAATWTDRTNSVALPITGQYTFDVLNGVVLIANSGFPSTSIAPLKITAYNSNIAALDGSPPVANIVRVVNNFAFLAENLSSTAALSRVYWSNVGDPKTWTSANFVDVRLNDGDVITGLSCLGTDLIIYKTNSIWRLSTTTTVISGTVSLGPLTMITDRCGCIGPLSHDVMPDGTLVFISSDGHLYQTDGASFVDLSSSPYPDSNIITPLATFFSSAFLITPLYNSFVRVDPVNHRIIVSFGALGQSFNNIYAYDYRLRAWSDITGINGVSNHFLSYLQLMPAATNSGQTGQINKVLYASDELGKIYSFYPSFSGPTNASSSGGSPTRADGQGLTCTLQVSLQLGGDSPPDFVPRSLIIPVITAGGGSIGTGGSITVTIGWDGVFQGTSAATYDINSLAGIRNRLSVPLPYTTAARPKPLTMQIKIVLTGGSIQLDPVRIDPFYISDEVLG